MSRRKWIWITLGVIVGIPVVLIAAGVIYMFWLESRIAGATESPKVDSFDAHCAPSDAACAAWASFRAAHPYPYQSFVLREAGDKQVLILSEPPPTLDRQELKNLVTTAWGRDLLGYEEKRWMIGEDGWLEDVVITARRSHEADLDDRVALLHQALFGTPYGAHLDASNDANAVKARASAPNLDVKPAEIHAWLQENISWKSIDPAETTVGSFSELDRRQPPGAFVSNDGELTLLMFPQDMLLAAKGNPAALDSLQANFRAFAVASDAVIGVVWTHNHHVSVIGRARVQPPEVLPPLRFETFRQLAAEQGGELQQSYERTTLFAGKMLSGKYALQDWAPIYLSNSLIDTEFGALLNITDQMLKSWSMAGTVNYLYFKYPLRPADGQFTFGKDSLLNLVKAKSETPGPVSVLFNWNTSGSAVVMRFDDMSMLTSRRTGALPVTYGSDLASGGEMQTGGELAEFENKAYDYFAGLRDPNLARVVSYTLLYQAFRAIAADRDTSVLDNISFQTPPARLQAVRVLQHEAAEAVRRLQDGSFSVLHTSPVRELAWLTDVDTLIDEELKPAFAQFASDHPALVNDPERLGWLIANLRSARSELRDGEAEALPELMELVKPLSDVLAYTRDLGEVREHYVASNSAAPAGRIKTPSVVISWQQNPMYATGGHNLTARTFRIEVTDRVADVELIERGEQRVLLVNSSKAEAVAAEGSDIARAVERGEVRESSQVLAMLEQATPPRARPVALEVAKPVPPEVWREPLAARSARAVLDDNSVRERLLALLRNSRSDAAIIRDANGFRVAAWRNLKPPPDLECCKRILDSLSAQRYIETIRGQTPNARIMFEGESAAHVEALTLSMSARPGERVSVKKLAEASGAGGGGRDGTYRFATLNGEEPPINLFLIADGERRGIGPAYTPRNWTSLRTRVGSDEQARQLLSVLPDQPARSDAEVPYLIELHFEPTSGDAAPIDAALIASLKSDQVEQGRETVHQALKQSSLGGEANAQSLVEGMQRLKAYVEAQRAAGSGAVTRLQLIIKEGRLQFLMTGHPAALPAPNS